jgi:hypothetical protein
VELGTQTPGDTGNTEEQARTAATTGTPDRVPEGTTMAVIHTPSVAGREARDNKARAKEGERTAAVDNTPDDSSLAPRANPRLPCVVGI